ncbi:response regulator [Synergistaceae bacterium OttesenSCG-928-I11]|nr:response regulator [Synergistaceae bacterium OttesenSCG-928-I11]
MENEISLPLTLDQQERLLDELNQARLADKKNQRTIRRLEHDKESINAMYENAIHLRDHNERERDKQSMYNRLMLQFFPGILLVLDDQLRYTIGTGAYVAQKFGFSDEKELNAQPLETILRGGADDAWVDRTLENCRHVLEGGDAMRYTDFLVFKDGDQVHANVTIAPAKRGGDVQGVLFLLDDVTELVKTKEKAEQAARSKSSFLANMSHEIRTPMNAIVGMGHLLETTELSEKQKDFLENLLRASDSLLDIINDILDFSKIDAQRFELVEQDYNLAELVGDVVNIVKLRAHEKRLALYVDISPDLARLYRGDNVRIKQILVNVLTNAIKYTKSGSIEMRVASSGTRAEGRLFFSVCDTGIGIREEDLPNLFSAFSQMDVRKNRNVEGTGLGLAISKGLAQAMNGDIFVESEYGVGSCFTVSLPQRVVDARPLIDRDALRGENVLLVERDESAASASRMLASIGVPFERLRAIHELTNIPDLTPYTCAIVHCDPALPLTTEDLAPLRALRTIFVTVMGAEQEQALPRGAVILYEPLLIDALSHALHGGAEDERGARREKLGAFTAPGARVLLVDDNEINLLVADEILRQYGLDVVPVSSGAEAIDAVKRERFDLVFMDHMMPEIDGVEATRRIRLDPGPNENVPIIALTANAVVGMEEYYLANQMSDFLSKPLDIEKLSEKLKRWLPAEKIRYAD